MQFLTNKKPLAFYGPNGVCFGVMPKRMFSGFGDHSPRSHGSKFILYTLTEWFDEILTLELRGEDFLTDRLEGKTHPFQLTLALGPKT